MFNPYARNTTPPAMSPLLTDGLAAYSTTTTYFYSSPGVTDACKIEYSTALNETIPTLAQVGTVDAYIGNNTTTPEVLTYTGIASFSSVVSPGLLGYVCNESLTVPSNLADMSLTSVYGVTISFANNGVVTAN